MTRHGVRPELAAQAPLVALDTLQHYPGNARQSDHDLLVESLTEHGQYQALVVQRSTRYVLIGNGRMDAMTDLGWTHAAVSWVDCDDARARRINLLDNKASDSARNNPVDEAALLRAVGPDLRGTGYVQAEVDRLLRKLDEPLHLAANDLPAPRTGAGLREALLVLPEADHAELVALFGAIRQATGDAPQGEVALLAARVAVAVLEGGAGHTPTCSCTWCTIAHQAGATRR